MTYPQNAMRVQPQAEEAFDAPAVMASAGESIDVLVAEISGALDEDRLTPHYQPVFDLASGRIAGFEALLRWDHAARGLLETAGFAAAFDHPDLARPLARHLLDRVGRHLAAWRAVGHRTGEIALNVSHHQLRQGGFADDLAEWLDGSGLAPDQVVIEIADDTAFPPTGAATAELARLGALGVVVALSNFGAGAASLAMLRQIPVDRIKIDRHFVARVEDDPDDAAMVAGLIGLAHGLGIKAVAEGIERPAQLAMLRAAGCDFAQGYLLGRPMPAAAVPHFAAGISR